MPIRAENKDRYPKEWPLISQRVRERAGHKCQHCGVRNGAWGYREEGRFHEVGREGFPHECRPPFDWGGRRIIRIVLTVAHLDHQPENCAWDNLRALCQRCHNRYDAKTRANGIRLRAMATPDLLTAQLVPNPGSRIVPQTAQDCPKTVVKESLTTGQHIEIQGSDGGRDRD